MSIPRIVFEEINPNDIDELVASQATESMTLEYKSATYGSDKEGKREFLKDISAFANKFGGDLIIGVKEANGVPTGDIGIEIDNADSEMQRLANLARDGLEPRIDSLQIKSIDVANSKKIIVIRVSQSWLKPHRVSAGGHNQFYVRNPAGCHPASVEEIRGMFLQQQTVDEQMLSLHRERIAFVRSAPLSLSNSIGLIVHIIPLKSELDAPSIDLASFAGKYILPKLPYSASALHDGFTIDGYTNRATSDGKTDAYSVLFRNAMLEAVDVTVSYKDQSEITLINVDDVQGNLIRFIREGTTFLRDNGIGDPLAVVASMFGAENVHFTKPEPYHFRTQQPPPIGRTITTFPLVRVDGSEDDVRKTLRPILDTLWNAAGHPGCPNFGEDGSWVTTVR